MNLRSFLLVKGDNFSPVIYLSNLLWNSLAE